MRSVLSPGSIRQCPALLALSLTSLVHTAQLSKQPQDPATKTVLAFPQRSHILRGCVLSWKGITFIGLGDRGPMSGDRECLDEDGIVRKNRLLVPMELVSPCLSPPNNKDDTPWIHGRDFQGAGELEEAAWVRKEPA